MYRVSVFFGACAFFLVAAPLAGQTGHEALITVKDLEDVTGLQGIKLVARDPTIGAGGDLNFALEGGTLLMTAGIQDAPMYDEWKAEEGFFHADVPDLGDEAFEGPTFGEHRFVLIFRKGGTAIALSSFFNMQAGGEPFLSQDQLREIARIAISRL